ncbi:hypothetical protein SAMN05444161_0008 [Rhizobiales bacterium GAS191]|nr:hypothetical protein SAMN05444161_0008 [Rhizobiales bacterium GAS191]
MAPLIGVRVKMERAKEHFDELAAAIQAFKSQVPYEFVIDTLSRTGYDVYRYRERQAVPIKWGAILGDCIHNLRSALDILAHDAVRESGNQPTNGTAFPICPDQAAFQRHTGINLASAAARQLAESFNPHMKGNDEWKDDLYRLHLIDIVDKHRLLIPVAAAKTYDHVQSSASASMSLNLALVTSIRKCIKLLKDGDEVAAYPSTSPPIHVEPIFDIAFGVDQVFDGEAVVPTLTALFNLTDEIIARFAGSILRVPWIPLRV